MTPLTATASKRLAEKLSAFPLMTPDFAAKRKASDSIPLRRLWLSDGGLTSNFPIHFFDSPFPARPTFCLNLIDYDASIGDGTEPDRDAEPAEGSCNNAPKTAADKPITQSHSEKRRATARRQTIPAGDPLPKDEVWGFISMADGNRLPPAFHCVRRS
jgi:hypothetical protein